MLTRPSSPPDTDVSVNLRPQPSSSEPAARSADMAPKGSNKQQSEEDLLLQDFSRNLSAKSTALFYGNALIVSAIPICEYRGAAKLAGLTVIHWSFGILKMDRCAFKRTSGIYSNTTYFIETMRV